MPRTIQAFFYQATSKPESEAMTRKVYAAFLEAHELDADTVPLLVYDGQAAFHNSDTPFALARKIVET